jgi:hypothetical protein
VTVYYTGFEGITEDLYLVLFNKYFQPQRIWMSISGSGSPVHFNVTGLSGVSEVQFKIVHVNATNSRSILSYVDPTTYNVTIS